MQKIINTKLKFTLRFYRFFCPPPLSVHLPITKKLLSSCLLNFSVNMSIIVHYSKHELPFVCLWKSGTLSPLNTMFICTLQTSSTKIILPTSKLHPGTVSIHTVNFGSSQPSPWLDLINPGLWYYNRHAYYRRNVALFSPCREQEGETTYFDRLNNYFVTQTKYSVNTVDLGPFRPLNNSPWLN